jgi:Flp pilus assembly protein TadD
MYVCVLQYRARQKRMQSACTPVGSHRARINKETEQELRSVLARDPTDERTYVVLGTLLLRQGRVEEAREVYEEGCAVAQGQNAYIWTAIGNLEKKVSP